ncbi:MAG: hypothetical protein ABTQ32_01780 [Myxococcaceae bacterium]
MRLVFFVAALTASFASAEFKRLHAERATASSFLESNWNKYQENYHPTYVLDDDPSTAWVEGVDGDGVGQSLTVKVSTLNKARAVRLVITPGYQKSKTLFAANGVPTSLAVVVRDAQQKQTASKMLEVAAKWGAQTFEVPLTGGLAEVTITIGAVKAGTKYRDTCISDLQLFVDSDVPYDKRVEDAKRAAMLAWKKERLAAAKYFGSLPATYPFVSTSWSVKEVDAEFSRRYSSVSEPNDEGGFRKGVKNPKFVELDALLDRGTVPDGFDPAAFKTLRTLVKDSKGGAWFSLSVKTRVRMPDGLDELIRPELLPLVRASDLTFFEASKPELTLTLRPLDRDASAPREAALSTVKLLQGTPAAPRRVFAKYVEVFSERADYEVTSWLLVDWGDDGLLRKMALWTEEFEISGGDRMREEATNPKDLPPEERRAVSQSAESWAFEVSDQKVTQITRRQLLSIQHDPQDVWGLVEDEGIRSLTFTFSPRSKK